MLEILGLTKRFGSLVAVDGVSLRVEPGEVLGFLGPNGAGKSTTMRMVAGFLPPTSGTARVCGHDVLAEPMRARARLGYLPEGAPAWPDMTPEGFLAFVADVRGLVRGLGRDAARRRIGEVAELVHLGPVLRRPIETLSKGFKRRVGLAQAILHDPDVLVLDEPTDGLDPNQKHEVRGLIRAMAASKTVVLSTHILEEVEAVCTRAVIIDRGRIVADGTPGELEARAPRHGAVRLAFDGAPPAGAREALLALAEVRGVEEDGGAWLALPAANGSAVAAVGAVARERGWRLAELSVERGRLDEVFRTITEAEFGSAGGPR